MKISAKTLEEHQACRAQVKLFRKLFGRKSVTPTISLCEQHASAFNWDWAAIHLLSAKKRKAYDELKATAPRTYEEAVGLARKTYEEAVDLARKTYIKSIARAFAMASTLKQ